MWLYLEISRRQTYWVLFNETLSLRFMKSCILALHYCIFYLVRLCIKNNVVYASSGSNIQDSDYCYSLRLFGDPLLQKGRWHNITIKCVNPKIHFLK